jgi:galactitol-specific phosphotransferase system IIB component
MNKWDERFAGTQFYYGTEPNAYFASFLKKQSKPGLMLLPGEGEGRNAVFAASRGWQVDAFDTSRVAIKKATTFARQQNVEINYQHNDVNSYRVVPEKYDLIALIFFHLPEQLRKIFHHQAVQSLKKGGVILVESFSKEQIKNNSGGPPDIAMLYTPEILKSDFSSLKVIELNKEREILKEGKHEGIADLVRFVGQKL